MSDLDASSSSNPTLPPGGERRRWARSAFQSPVVCYLKPQPDQAVGPVPVNNLSAGGIFLALDEGAVPGKLLTVSLYNKVLKVWRNLEVRAVYVIAEPGGKFWVGGAFTQALSEEEVKAFR